MDLLFVGPYSLCSSFAGVVSWLLTTFGLCSIKDKEFQWCRVGRVGKKCDIFCSQQVISFSSGILFHKREICIMWKLRMQCPNTSYFLAVLQTQPSGIRSLHVFVTSFDVLRILHCWINTLRRMRTWCSYCLWFMKLRSILLSPVVGL
jgi:hypothetical protein